MRAEQTAEKMLRYRKKLDFLGDSVLWTQRENEKGSENNTECPQRGTKVPYQDAFTFYLARDREGSSTKLTGFRKKGKP